VSRIRYEVYPQACRVIARLVESLDLSHIDPSRIHCVRSVGARTRAIARIYGLPRPWIVAGCEPGYVIEVVSEKFDALPCEEKIKTLIHELLHIPRGFSGGLRPHGRLVNGRRVYQLYRRLGDSVRELCGML